MEDFTTNQIEHLIDCLNFYYSENDDKKIDIGGGISILMKYPSMDEFLITNFTVTDKTDDDGFSFETYRNA